ncbi:MAG: NADPH:quinone oxidoreductase [Melioribacteraceae bacterium]|nr:MAG: NADPH:quinone oxidoreductase [Melioribacteraceae bacterium]
MQAAVHYKYGPPEVISIKDVEKPVPAKDELLIKVYAATVNRTDCGWLFGEPPIIRLFAGLLKPKYPITGTDFAGIVEETGKEISNFKVGDRVFGFDDTCVLSHAQYMVIKSAKGIATIPEKVSFEQAAASIEGAHYAYNFITKFNLREGDEVLLNGASGAIGSAGLQLLKYFGAYVTAVTETKNVALVKSLGADEVIDFTQHDFTKTSKKYDYVFDAVGKSSFDSCKPILKERGIYLSSELGDKSENIFLALRSKIYGKKKVIFPFPSDVPRSIALIRQLLEEGKFKPVIDRVYQLEEIVEAFNYVASGKKTGNVVLALQ